jgi:hypothetical protein
MKSLREILLQRHQDAEPKLDHVRQKALESLRRDAIANTRAAANESEAGTATIWISRLLSLRWHFAALTAAWLAAALISRDPAPPLSVRETAQADHPSPRHLLLALRENRRQLLELIEPPMAQPISGPKRRSALEPPTQMV